MDVNLDKTQENDVDQNALLEPADMEASDAELSEQGQEKKKKPGKKIAFIILLIIVIAGASYYYWKSQQPKGPNFAPNASIGPLPDKTQEEIEAMLNQQIAEGMVAFSINAQPSFANGTAKGNLLLESPANNINLIEFVITRNDNDEVVYTSGLLAPNQYIEYDKLSVDLPQGRYPCVATVTLYDKTTYEAKGVAQADVLIIVKG